MSTLASFLTRTAGKVLVALVLVIVGSAFVVRASELIGTTEAEPTPSPTAEVAAEPTPTPFPTESAEAAAATFKLNGGGAKNIVLVKNRTDGNLLVRGRLDLNRTGGERLAPVNIAYAMSLGCTDCSTLALAAQITLYRRSEPSVVAPQNAAVAVNAGTRNAVSGAWAAQYLIPVDNMNEVPRDVDAMVRALDAEFRSIETAASRGEISVEDAIARLRGILARFEQYGDNLKVQSAVERQADTPSPYPSPPPEESPTPTDATPEQPVPSETAAPSP